LAKEAIGEIQAGYWWLLRIRRSVLSWLKKPGLEKFNKLYSVKIFCNPGANPDFYWVGNQAIELTP